MERYQGIKKDQLELEYITFEMQYICIIFIRTGIRFIYLIEVIIQVI